MIKLDGVTKAYDGIAAVKGVSLDIGAGEWVAVLGPSGSGKTTLLRLIAGLEVPDAGEIRIEGELASGPGWALAPHKRDMGYVFQSPALWPHMTVAQNILFALNGQTKVEANHRLEELLDKTSLTGLAKRYPHQVSGGEARRVALARALAPRRGCLLMDEPLTNLDSDLKLELLDLIRKSVGDEHASLIYVTHDVDEALCITNRLLTLKNGCLEAESESVDPSPEQADDP